MMSDQQSQAIWELIRDQQVCMLSWSNGQGPQSIPLLQLQSSFDGTLWFFLPPRETGKELPNHDTCVSLQYMNHSQALFISVRGIAAFLSDSQLVQHLWCPEIASQYSASFKPEDSSLLEVYVEDAKAWNLNTNATVHLYRGQ